jgi:adenylate cyclase
LTSGKGESLGSMLLIEDISSEKRVRSTMSRYMDPGLADKLLSAGDGLLGGQASVATVLFSDIRSFTTLTEELGAQGTVTLLNEYFSIMVECIQAEGGMLDKFIGDAIMALWGAPIAHEDDPDRAMLAAMDMQRALKDLNAKWQNDGRPEVAIGIGINHGEVFAGNIGSHRRLEYTVIGDSVNVASRLCGRADRGEILISQRFYDQLKERPTVETMEPLSVKNRNQAVPVYRVRV